jgi:hypothetical protein
LNTSIEVSPPFTIRRARRRCRWHLHLLRRPRPSRTRPLHRLTWGSRASRRRSAAS